MNTPWLIISYIPTDECIQYHNEYYNTGMGIIIYKNRRFFFSKCYAKYNQRIINRHNLHPEYLIKSISPCGFCRGVSENGEMLSMFKLFFIQEGSYHFALPYTRSSNGGCWYYIFHLSEISFIHFDSSRNIKIPYLICDYILHNK